MRTTKFMAHGALVLSAGLVVWLAGCGGGDDGTTPLPPTQANPEDLIPEVQVQTVDRLFRGSGLSDENLGADPILSLIASATSTLDIAVTLIDRQDLVQALLNEATSGTNIRIVTEKEFYEDPQYAVFYQQLEDPLKNSGNIQVHTDDDGAPRLMQSRFIVVDNARVVTGSYNWESSTAGQTFGDIINILNTGVAAAFTNQFNQMFVEGNFGVNKRDDTQHSFLVGGGRAQLEVYFGPTDRPRDLLQREIDGSDQIAFAIQQYKDVGLANFMFDWLNRDPNNLLLGVFNDIATLGDAEENAVYLAFANYIGAPTGGDAYVNLLIDAGQPTGGAFSDYNTMNHKMLFANRGIDGDPAIVTTTSNYSDLGLSLNDQVTLVFRGTPLVRKFLRSINYTSSVPPLQLREANDSQEFDQLFTMYPYAATEGAAIRPINRLPTALVFGEVSNFKPVFTIANDDGTFTEVAIDLVFGISSSELFFGGTFPDEDLDPSIQTPDGDTVFPAPYADPFERSETLNPNHRFMLVVPAGNVTVHTVVISADSADEGVDSFQVTQETFDIGPGAVKEVNLAISPAAQEPSGTI